MNAEAIAAIPKGKQMVVGCYVKAKEAQETWWAYPELLILEEVSSKHGNCGV